MAARRLLPSPALGRFALAVAVLAGTPGCGWFDDLSPPQVAPAISRHPAGVSATVCESVTFQVAATGTLPLQYQWLHDGSPIPGATKAILQLARAALRDDGSSFSVQISNAAGAVTSNLATLAVSDTALPVVLSDSLFLGIRSDSGAVYWADGRKINVSDADCNGDIQVLYSMQNGLENTNALALTADRVVWSDTVTGSVRTVPRTGGAAVTLASGLGGTEPYVIAAAGNEVYWPHVNKGIQRVSIGGGPVETIVSMSHDAGGLAVANGFVYWTDMADGTVMQVPVSGGTPVTLASGLSGLGWVAADAVYVYWINWTTPGASDSSSEIDRVSVAGGPIEQLATFPYRVYDLFLDGNDLYTAGSSFALADGAVWRLPLNPAAPPIALATGLHLPGNVSADAANLYWAESRGIVRMHK
jgi:hypothetical protein